MSYSNMTTTLELPQWLESDKPNWDIDLNEAFEKIDDFAGEEKQKTQQDTQKFAELEQQITRTNEAVSANTQAIQAVTERQTATEEKDATQDQSISKLNNDVAGITQNVSGVETELQTTKTSLEQTTEQVNLNTQNIVALQNAPSIRLENFALDNITDFTVTNEESMEAGGMASKGVVTTLSFKLNVPFKGRSCIGARIIMTRPHLGLRDAAWDTNLHVVNGAKEKTSLVGLDSALQCKIDFPATQIEQIDYTKDVLWVEYKEPPRSGSIVLNTRAVISASSDETTTILDFKFFGFFDKYVMPLIYQKAGEEFLDFRGWYLEYKDSGDTVWLTKNNISIALYMAER